MTTQNWVGRILRDILQTKVERILTPKIDSYELCLAAEHNNDLLSNKQHIYVVSIMH